MIIFLFYFCRSTSILDSMTIFFLVTAVVNDFDWRSFMLRLAGEAESYL
ncbi:hypothetical protein M988_3593 [Hafnia paralvei ATCC 29927]|jgi:hypothetical protein|nr:hypothetical protein M988_3593 [Hafnia paralvei ATCC 29927]